MSAVICTLLNLFLKKNVLIKTAKVGYKKSINRSNPADIN